MSVNGVPFLATLSRKIKLFTVEFLPSRTAAQLTQYLVKVSKLRGGFTVRTILMDQEFDNVMEKTPTIEINTTAAREYIGEIERGIRLVKERCGGTLAIMPFQQIPKWFAIYLVHFYVMWLNSFTANKGISKRNSHHEKL